MVANAIFADFQSKYIFPIHIECLPVKLPIFQDFNLLLVLWVRNKYLVGLIGPAIDLFHARDH